MLKKLKKINEIKMSEEQQMKLKIFHAILWSMRFKEGSGITQRLYDYLFNQNKLRSLLNHNNYDFKGKLTPYEKEILNRLGGKIDPQASIVYERTTNAVIAYLPIARFNIKRSKRQKHSDDKIVQESGN